MAHRIRSLTLVITASLLHVVGVGTELEEVCGTQWGGGCCPHSLQLFHPLSIFNFRNQILHVFAKQDPLAPAIV